MDWGVGAFIVIGFALSTFTLCLTLTPLRLKRKRPVPVRAINRRTFGDWDKLIVVEPYDQEDPFCTCPDCYWLGNHAVEIMPPQLHSEPAPAETVTLGTWANPNIRQVEWRAMNYGWLAKRTCNMCGRVWHTHANPQPEE